MTAATAADALGGLAPDVLDRLHLYLESLTKWQRAINLVGPSTLADPWRRHILDSAQCLPYLASEGRLADLGSGAGLPGLILAICSGRPVHLIESDQRKAAFLREAARVCEVDATVHAARIDAVPPLAAATVTARALAPLPRLLPWIHRHLGNPGRAVLLKGKAVEDELTESGKQWKMTTTRADSITDPGGTLLLIENLAPLDVG